MDGTGNHYLVCWVWQRAMPGLCVSSERAGWEEGKGKSEFTEGFTEGDAVSCVQEGGYKGKQLWVEALMPEP